MEDAMLSIRIVTTGAVLIFAVASAAAQSATDGSPGKPLSIVQVKQPGQAKQAHAKAPAKLAKQMPAEAPVVMSVPAKPRKALAAGRSRRMPMQAEAVAPAASIWPAANSAVPGAIAALAPAPAPSSAFTEPAAATAPSELVVDGQTVQVASPDDVNAIDLAANDHDGAAKAATPGGVGQPERAVQAMIATRDSQDANTVGSASWIAQVLAALGGAIAAGVVAWFLIGPVPHRIYG
jgi:hypothetical protein